MGNSDDEVDFLDFTHEELLDILDKMLLSSQTILSKYNELKNKNKKLVKENSALQSKNHTLKENLQDSTLNELKVENQMLHQKVNIITKDLANFVKGTENLEMFGSAKMHYQQS